MQIKFYSVNILSLIAVGGKKRISMKKMFNKTHSEFDFVQDLKFTALLA